MIRAVLEWNRNLPVTILYISQQSIMIIWYLQLMVTWRKHPACWAKVPIWASIKDQLRKSDPDLPQPKTLVHEISPCCSCYVLQDYRNVANRLGRKHDFYAQTKVCKDTLRCTSKNLVWCSFFLKKQEFDNLGCVQSKQMYMATVVTQNYNFIIWVLRICF